MSDVWGYEHTLRIYNTYCFSTATLVARTRLNITLYVHYLSCFSDIYIKHIDFLCSRTKNCLVLNVEVQIVTTRLQRLMHAFFLCPKCHTQIRISNSSRISIIDLQTVLHIVHPCTAVHLPSCKWFVTANKWKTKQNFHAAAMMFF